MNDTFITYASEILADTKKGLSGSQIVKYCSLYAVEFNVAIPYSRYPFPVSVGNKRTALRDNLLKFSPPQRYTILMDLCELPMFSEDSDVEKLKEKMITQYGHLNTASKFSDAELIQKTKHWLENYPDSLKLYEEALSKFENKTFERNTLDDMRLSFELLVKNILQNNKSLENQISEIGRSLKDGETSAELRNMTTTLITYYTHYQNSYVKHDDKVNKNEIEYIIELTSLMMKFLIKELA